MKRVVYFRLLGCMIILMGTSCTNGNKQAAETVDVDSVLVTEKAEEGVIEVAETNLFNKWFEEFQEANPHWTRTTEGHKKFTDAFKKEMKSNLEFAKSVCMDKVFTSECITSYDRKDGEHGGIWSFVFRKTL